MPKPAGSSVIRQKPATAAPAPVAATSETVDAPRPAPAAQARPSSLEPAQPEVYNFRFSAGPVFRWKLERLAEVIGVRHAARNMAKVLEKALDVALEQKDPRRKQERRNERAKAAGSSPSRLDEISVKADAPTSRRIPAAVRGLVSERAGYRCEFEGPDGVRCSERTGLEVDHIRPFARGGTHHESNLRLLCGAHNRWCAEREFGAEFIRDKIDRARSG